MGYNIRECEKYLKKQEMLGVKIFKFNCVKKGRLVSDMDKVVLEKYIEDDEEYRRIVIPEFITEVHEPFSDVTQNLSITWKNTGINHKILSLLFDGYKGKELELNGINTSKITDMSGMFYQCVELRKLKINKFDTSNVIDMTSMFKGCVEIEEINLNSLNTDKVVSMSNMFSNCMSLKEVYINNFNTSKVKEMGNMFYGCGRLEELNISNFDLNALESCYGMFHGCSRLKTIVLKNNDTYNKLKNLGAFLNSDLEYIKFEYKED